MTVLETLQLWMILMLMFYPTEGIFASANEAGRMPAVWVRSSF